MSGVGSGGEMTVAVGNAEFALASAPLVDVASAASSPAANSAATNSASAAADRSLPCSQGRIGEGCAPLAAGSSLLPTQEASAAGAASVPPPNLPLQAGGGAKAQESDLIPASTPASAASTTKHTATIGHHTKPQAFAKPSDGPGVGGAVFALILVVSLILALGWLAKRMPGFGRAAGGGGNALRVVGSLSLGPRDRVVVVEVGNTQLLLGVGQNGMTTLHTLAEPLPAAQVSQGASQGLGATPFAQLLAQHFGKKP